MLYFLMGLVCVLAASNFFIYFKVRKKDYEEVPPRNSTQSVVLLDIPFVKKLSSSLKSNVALDIIDSGFDVCIETPDSRCLYPYSTIRLTDLPQNFSSDATFDKPLIAENEEELLSSVSLNSILAELNDRATAAVVMLDLKGKKPTDAGLKLHLCGHDYQLSGLTSYLCDNLYAILGRRHQEFKTKEGFSEDA